MPQNQVFVLQEQPQSLATVKTWELEESSIPSPIGDGELLLKALYISVDPYLRSRIRQGVIGQPTVSGQVAEVVESKKTPYKKGDLIFAYLPWSRYTVTKGNDQGFEKIQVPPNVSPSAALGVLGMPGMTAYFGLKNILKIKKGETVVVSGAAGAVGSLAGQLARYLYGAGKVIGTAGGPEKCAYAKKQYAFDEVIDYKKFDTKEKIQAEFKRLAPNGVDAYFDNTGGHVTHALWDVYNKFARVAVCGQISIYGPNQVPKVDDFLPKTIYSSITIQGFYVGDYMVDSERGQSQVPDFYREVGPPVAQGKIKFDEHIVNGFEKIPEAFISLFHGANVGKVVVKVE